MVNDEFYLALALNEAWKYQGLTYPNPAVGCAVVDKSGVLLSVCAHKKAGLAHAELEAAKEALKKLNPLFEFPEEPNELHDFILKNHQNLLKNSTFYTTLEPCIHQGKTPSCADLIISLGISRVIVGALDKNKIASGGIEKLKSAGINVIYNPLGQKCEELIEPFSLWQNGRFSFFKLAMRLDGTYDNGLITSLETRRFMHEIRSICDLIMVGGNTVRTDKPTLDTRLYGGKTPDIAICTKCGVDKTAPLFSLKNRRVSIQENLSFPDGYQNIMIEGGVNFLNAMKDRVDWFLLMYGTFFSKIGKNSPFVDLQLRPLYISHINGDTFGWYKKV